MNSRRAMWVLLLTAAPGLAAELPWVSPNRYRTLLTVEPRSVRTNSPVSVELNLAELLSSAGGAGTFDQSTIEVVAYDAVDSPKSFDAARPGYEQYLLPWRIERGWKTDQVTFSFVMPNHLCTRFALFYDTVESGRATAQRYPGLVGNGDRFCEGFGRREINACGYDTWCDLDRDGDLDLFKGGTEPYIYCYENVGGNRFVDAGKLTSAGSILQLPMDGNIRTWASVEFVDWDRDGDQDLFFHSPTGPHESASNTLWCYPNVTTPGGPLTFAEPQRVLTRHGRLITSGVTFVDWDDDGKTDALGGSNGLINLYRNVGSTNSISDIQLDDPEYIRANGVEIQVMNPKVDCRDIDADGDLDMFVGTEEGRIYFYENVGTRALPVFTMGRVLAFHEYMDARARPGVADFDGDGLLDFVPGRYWERTQWGEQPRVYGRMYKNVGTPTAPRFQVRDASNGAPYTEQFQIADAVRQNGVRVADWNNDGRPDLIAGDTDGFVWWFRNTTNRLFPVFAAGYKILAGGQALRVYGEDRVFYPWNPDFVDECRAAGYARVEVCDWSNDGRKDLLVADGRAWLYLYLNTGTDASPILDAGTRVTANGQPIDGTSRGSVLVCDWNGDGLKDVIFGMVNNQGGYSGSGYGWPDQTGDKRMDGGFLFYKNIGSDDAPMLDAPSWIQAAGRVITYPSRPNLGSFVDWDGDGKKDFIGAEFEHAVHFYKNVSPSTTGEPVLAAGICIVRASSFQMISGAEAVDWNGDGDIDIVTGQGHGGSGLRFFERDYINDYVNEKVYGINTWPVTSVGRSEPRVTRADFDRDDDVDQDDFGRFQQCYSGENRSCTPECAYADLDGDTDVDQWDFKLFAACFAGPRVAPACTLGA